LIPYYISNNSKIYFKDAINPDIKTHTHIYDKKSYYKYAAGVFNFSQLNAENLDLKLIHHP